MLEGVSVLHTLSEGMRSPQKGCGDLWCVEKSRVFFFFPSFLVQASASMPTGARACCEYYDTFPNAGAARACV